MAARASSVTVTHWFGEFRPQIDKTQNDRLELICSPGDTIIFQVKRRGSITSIATKLSKQLFIFG